jgi:poly-gamma-glutamate synthesis protein (capsule biosynthesis protein)
MARPGQADPLALARPLLAAADLAVANLEGQLTGAPRQNAGYYLTGEPRHVALLAGLDLVSLANNHATDNGREGLAESIATLRAAGIRTVGGGLNQAEAQAPAILEQGGLRLGVLAYNFIPPTLAATAAAAGAANYDEAAALAAVRALRPQVDVLVVTPHWGVEYQPRPSSQQRRVARVLVEAGADAVIGHHPHVVQSLEWLEREGRRPALVAYSLGNFVFDSYDPDAKRGALLYTRLEPGGVTAWRAQPFRTDWRGLVPLAAPRDQEALLARLLPRAADRRAAAPGLGSGWLAAPAGP